MEKCLYSTSFSFQGQLYKSTPVTLLGSPLSPVDADIFMESFEMKSFESSHFKSKIWLRCFDDTFIVWSHETLQIFLYHLNNRHTYIIPTLNSLVNLAISLTEETILELPCAISAPSFRRESFASRVIQKVSYRALIESNL